MGYNKGHYGKYTGNARCCMDHAHTDVTKSNYKAAERDDAAHIDYLKRDVLYDDHHGHSDEKMTADEKHISKLAGDMKYDKKHHGSAVAMKDLSGDGKVTKKDVLIGRGVLKADGSAAEMEDDSPLEGHCMGKRK